MPSSDYKLYAANGTEIVTYGTKVRNLDIGLRRQFQWPFVIANTNRAIIGADFLNNFGLIIDIKNKRLIDGITNLSIRGVIQSISDMGNISTLNSSTKVSAILTKYPNLCRPPSDFVEAKHSVKHYIPTRGQPIHSKARRLDSQRLTLAKAEFQYMLNNGIIRPSNSSWASPLHLVSKRDESLRPCGDYRRLNAVTLPDRYPIPRLDDFHHILKGTRVYSKIDLCKAFYQIPIAEEDKPKTAIITPFGLFEFNVMSFGLRNATATFQRFMHEVLRNLDFAFFYLDDILVASKTEEEHYSHLETLFSRLNSYGLRINLSKSKFLVQEIDFLGYLITSHGVKPLPTKVKAILEYKKPKTVHELRIFLGMLNFYRTFLNNAAETQAILHEYLRGAKKKDRSEIKWTEEAEVQFEKCKQALANTALLAYPDTELPISLCTDASDRAVGSVLQQLDNNNWKPIAFFSKKLNPAQCNYSTYDRELLAIYLSIKFFKHLLEAREFTILTDHKPLIYAFKQKNEKASPRQLRHLQYISQFTTDIKYIKGTDNIVADALSRVDAITTIDYEEIAKEQTGDSELQNLISKNTSLKFKQCPLQSGNLLWCDVSTNNIRPFIPIKFRMMVFRNFHELSHPGIKATTKQLTSRFIWPNMNKDIRKWAQACVNCQKCKVSIHTKSEIGKYQDVDERFSVIHIDLIGALPPSNGNIYCLTCIDRYTSWMEVVPLPDMKSETVARAFYENWIVRFGAPHTVISDQGKQFTSQLFKDLTTLCGIKLRHSTAYHPQCNGKIERLHRTIKTAIRAHNSIKWTETLPTVLLGLRAVLSTKIPTILCLRWYMAKPSDCLANSLMLLNITGMLKNLTDRVKKPLEPPYEGPFPVLERTDKYFTLKVKGKNVTTSIDRLRPAYLLADSDNITAEHPTAARPIVSGALPSTSSQQNPDPPDVEKYTEFQGTGSAPDLPRTRSGRIIKKPRFKGRFHISQRRLCGEGASISPAIIDEHLTNLNSILANSGYDPTNIYNANETGLFFQLIPDRTLAHKDENCRGVKRMKQRITVLLCCNSTGTDKRRLLIIGKSAKPRCFRNFSPHFYCTYTSNSKAWMTSSIFQEWLLQFNKQLVSEGRRILLFGIIKSFKAQYRKLQLQKMVELADAHLPTELRLDYAVLFCKMAWDSHSKRATSDDVNLSADLLRRVYAISEGEKRQVVITDFFKKRCEALKSLDVALKYLEKRTEPEMLASYNTINSLRTMLMREEEALLNKPKKQTTISNFFAKS
ncbi:hypothetical protein LAZ67_4001317 [Cordylochernes scorpioides]|uniref:RNA-directed DNA polymerase n=1 Tax=Cordylochernes scorpioides TaxID=51811 RepID=A0ABY6KEW7_9ARAC|nr:hypothetical protein LAZ67_4001317 [Cordylochernes scorpioides]